MESKEKICDKLLLTLQETKKFKNTLVDLEYDHEQGKVIATIGADTKHVDVSGYTGEMMIIHLIECLLGMED